jgi:antitoxin YefM
MLQTANFSEHRANLKSHCERVVDDNVTLIVTRTDGKDVVVQSLDNFNMINNELQKIKMELAIQKMMARAEKEIAEGKFVSLDDAVVRLRTGIDHNANS